MNAIAVQLDEVTKLFGGAKAVDNISFSIPTGSLCGFLGPNGAGKTTTIRLILEILKPTHGAISVLGRPSALQVRQLIGYLPEERGLYKKMKAWAIIAYFATLKGMPRRPAKLRAFELLERYGLSEFAHQKAEALSKGMCQKLQILACLAHDPELVILDEPFSGLDPVNQQVTEQIIQDLVARNRTVLFSTHVMQHAERICDRLLLIAKGRKIFDGTVADAKRTLPRHVTIETGDGVAPLRDLPGVIGVEPVLESTPPSDSDGRPFCARWRIQISDQSDPQLILQACFAQSIRLRRFSVAEPTLHDVFVHLVNSQVEMPSK